MIEAPLPQAASADRFPGIGEYAFLSDCHTGALVAPDSAVEWLCVPRFDSPSVFGAMLDRAAGAFRFAPTGSMVPVARRYIPGTNVLETTWMADDGWVAVREAMIVMPSADGTTAVNAPGMLVRSARCVEGEVEMEVVCQPAPDYAMRGVSWKAVERSETSAIARPDEADEPVLHLSGDIRLRIEGTAAGGRRILGEREPCFCCLSWRGGADMPEDPVAARLLVDQTALFWRRWLEQGSFPEHPWRAYLQRSALTLKGLMYAPSGGTVAALTTSLPETPGGARNWDYRYTWIRDATFALWGLHVIGFDAEAEDFLRFVTGLCHEAGPDSQIMFGIDGRSDLTEETLDHLGGYRNSRPVRIGNAAYDQRQNDVYGALLDSVYVHSKTREEVPTDLWRVVKDQVEGAARVWREPDQGIWEARGKPRHYVSSKLMCWVALDRGVRLARGRDEEALRARWSEEADVIRADILARGVSDRGVFRQHYDTDALDASSLLIPLLRFLPPSDDRVRATVLAVADELTERGLVLRYQPEETDDGLRGAREGTFTICSYWLVAALSEIGEAERARDLCQRLLGLANPLGLYAEEIESRSGVQLGNFPQAFTHLSLINAVEHVIADERAGPRRGKSAVFTEMRPAV